MRKLHHCKNGEYLGLSGLACSLEQVYSFFFFCFGGPVAGVGRVGLGPLFGFFPLFTPEFSQQEKKFSAEITMSTLPKWVI